MLISFPLGPRTTDVSMREFPRLHLVCLFDTVLTYLISVLLV